MFKAREIVSVGKFRPQSNSAHAAVRWSLNVLKYWGVKQLMFCQANQLVCPKALVWWYVYTGRQCVLVSDLEYTHP